MLLIINKKANSNQWDYPETPQLFKNGIRNPLNKNELIADYLGEKTAEELGLVVYTGEAFDPVNIKIISMSDFGELLPDAVIVELEDMKIDKAAGGPKRI